MTEPIVKYPLSHINFSSAKVIKVIHFFKYLTGFFKNFNAENISTRKNFLAAAPLHLSFPD